MILEKITIEEILERYTTLPDEILDVLEDSNTEEIVKNICERNNIVKPEWIEIIKQLVAATLLGFIHYYDLGAEINLALNSSNSKLGKDIAQEIEAKIFVNIKSLLEKNYSPPKIKDSLDLMSEKMAEATNIREIPQEIGRGGSVDKQPQPTQSPKIIFEITKEVPLKDINTAPSLTLAKNNVFSSMKSETHSLIGLKPKLTPESTDFFSQKQKLENQIPPLKIAINTKPPQPPQPSQLLQLPPLPQSSQTSISPSLPPTKLQSFDSSPSPLSQPPLPQSSIPQPPQPPFTSASPSSSLSSPKPPPFSSTPPKQSPIFLYKEEKVTPIKSGIEISSKDIKISEVKSPPLPPKPAEIEIGTKNSKLDSKIKIVNYSEETSKKDIPKPPKPNP